MVWLLRKRKRKRKATVVVTGGTVWRAGAGWGSWAKGGWRRARVAEKETRRVVSVVSTILLLWYILYVQVLLFLLLLFLINFASVKVAWDASHPSFDCSFSGKYGNLVIRNSHLHSSLVCRAPPPWVYFCLVRLGSSLVLQKKSFKTRSRSAKIIGREKDRERGSKNETSFRIGTFWSCQTQREMRLL